MQIIPDVNTHTREIHFQNIQNRMLYRLHQCEKPESPIFKYFLSGNSHDKFMYKQMAHLASCMKPGGVYNCPIHRGYIQPVQRS